MELDNIPFSPDLEKNISQLKSNMEFFQKNNDQDILDFFYKIVIPRPRSFFRKKID